MGLAEVIWNEDDTSYIHTFASVGGRKDTVSVDEINFAL